MKKFGLILLLGVLACLLALPAMAQVQELSVIRINYAVDTTLSQEKAVEAQVTLVQDGQENTFEAMLRLNDAGLDIVEQLLPQKSLRVDSDNMRFILYNDGYDAFNTKIISAVCYNLIAQSSIEVAIPVQEPVEVYLNGEYCGLYTWRQVTEDAIARFEGFGDTAALNVANVNKDLICGDVSGIKEAIECIKRLNLSREEDKKKLEELLDTESFLNWLAVNFYFGTGNLYSEIVFYQIGDGAVKCAMGDLAYAFLNASANHFNTLSSDLSPQTDTVVLAKMMLKQPVYRDAFLSKLGVLYQELPTSVMQAAADAENDRIAAALTEHMGRWSEEFAQVLGTEYGYSVADTQEAVLFQNYRVSRLRDKTLVQRPWYLYDNAQNGLALSEADMVRYFATSKPELPEVTVVTWDDYKTANQE